MNKNDHELRPGTIFFFHHATWSPVGVLLVLTGPERGNDRWHFRQLDGLEQERCSGLTYVDDDERCDITIIGQLPSDRLDATVFEPSYEIGRFKPASTNRFIRLLKRLW